MYKLSLKNIIPLFFFLIFSLLVFPFFSDYESLKFSFDKTQFENLITPLILIFLAYISKFYRWNFYIKDKGIKLNIITSFLIYISGLTMSVTPGKFGEIYKSYLLNKNLNVAYSKSLPVIFAERIIELLVMGIITILILLLTQHYNYLIYLFITLSLLTIITLIFRSYFMNKLVNIFEKRFSEMINEGSKEFFHSLKQLFRINILLVPTILSLIAWVLELFSVYLVLIMFNNKINIITGSFSYLSSLWIGAVSFLPGGVIATESSLLLSLNSNNFLLNDASVAIIIIRFITLWIPVIIGIVGLIFIGFRSSEKKNG